MIKFRYFPIKLTSMEFLPKFIAFRQKLYNWSLIKLIAGIMMVVISQPAYSSSQENRRIVNYGLEEGLSQISINAIIQDSYGFLWIGTQDGLNKFDGYEFTVYRHQPSDPHSLSNSYIQSVIEDSEGNIWAGTQNGLNKFDRNSNHFEIYLHEPGNPESLSHNNIYHVYQDKTGMIWLKTKEGLDRFDPVTGVFRHFRHYNDVFNYISGTNYFSIYEDNEGELWVGSKDGLLMFDRRKEEFVRYYHKPEDPATISNDKIKSVFETSEGFFLVGTENGLNVFDKKKGIFSTFFVTDAAGTQSRLNNINSISEDDRGTVWIGTDGGLFTFLPEEGVFSAAFETDMQTPFSDIEISAVIEDQSKNLWIGTLGGLYMVDVKSKFSLYRIHELMPEAPRAARFIASILPEGDNELWLGTWGGGLFRLNRDTGEIVHYSSNSEQRSRQISNDFVHVMFRDTTGRIILGTRDGLDIYSGKEMGFVPFCFSVRHEDCLIFNSNRIYSIYEDSRQVIWVGSRYGLHSFSGDSLTSYYHNPADSTSIASNRAVDVIEGREGYIWVATSDGLSRFNRETGTFRNYRKEPEMGRFSLSHNELTCLHEDSAGNLWIGSVAGLNRFFRNTGSFIVYSELEGLPNNLIYSILEDDNGYLWLSTNLGLARFDPASLDVSGYDVADGLQSYEFNLGAGYKSGSGELFFGGVDGLNSFFPDSILSNSNIPPLVVTAFKVFSPDGTRTVNVLDKDQIILGHVENSISIEFSALDFTRPSKNEYAYMLEGLDDAWIYSDGRRIAGYSRIPPGKYTFRVKGSNNDGVWNEQGLELSVVIRTPWWQSVYAYFLYAIIIVLLVYLIILFSTRQLRKANLGLREKEMATAEITRQKEELSLKNKNITDSINYAKRIQLAMMPNTRHFRRLFPESFVYYKPKDIVSGDFYWVNRINDKIFFAVIDCTGHGVPGAFMSIIGYELLRNIINVKGIEKPSAILDMLNEDFSAIFDPGDDKEYSFRDGMDIGFCVIDRKKARLEFAGAFSPLYLVRDNRIIEIKGNRFSVGLMEDLIDDKFENHTLALHSDDMVYLFSDGYPDQFGGEEGKKFKYRRFRHLLLNIHKLPALEQEKALDHSIIQWMGELEQVDDILIIGVKPGLGKE